MAPSTRSFTKAFTTLLTTILLSSLLFSDAVSAAPWPQYAKHGTHRRRLIGRGVQVESYHPKTSFKTFGSNGTVVPATSSGNSFTNSSASLKDTAMAYMAMQGFGPDAVAWNSGFSAGSAGFAYMKQVHDGVPFANAVCNVALKGDKVASWGTSFVDLSKASIAPSTPSVSWRSVLPNIESQLAATYNNQTALLEYFAQPDGSVALTHVLQLQNRTSGAYYEAYIDAHTGDLVSVTDFVSHASYTVVPITRVSFADGVETLTDPEDLESSPFGWHSFGRGVDTTTTSGNNVVAFQGRSVAEETRAGLNFNAEYDDQRSPRVAENIAAATTNAFYVINTMHDVLYRYGFTEDAFNFQINNNGNGGRGQDRVEISVQDASGTNNANFATPPDGIPGECRMFVWTLTDPPRDGAMENDIVIHEFTHGLTNRMTGGGTGRCLQTLESGGMGEGWSDAMADWFFQSSATTTDFGVGTYVTNQPEGLRRHPYSTNPATNPLRYSSLQELDEVHDIGEVWANMLHNVYAALVDQRGFSEDKLTNPDATEGNVVFMRLFVDALALQPCSPTFVQARDAIIQADENRYNGANRCTLFRAFASRGLGLNADDSFEDDTTVPPECGSA